MNLEKVAQADSPSELTSALQLLLYHGTDKTFSSAKTRDTLLKKWDLVAEPQTAILFFKVFAQFGTIDENSRTVACRKQVHNCFTQIYFKYHRHIHTREVANVFLDALVALTLGAEDEGDFEAFVSPSILKILIKMAPFFIFIEQNHHDEGDENDNNNMMATPQIPSSTAPTTTTTSPTFKGAQQIMLAIANLTSSAIGRGRRLFACEKVRHKIFGELATTICCGSKNYEETQKAMKCFVQAVSNITDWNEEPEEEDDENEEQVNVSDFESLLPEQQQQPKTKKKEKEECYSFFPNKTFIKYILGDLLFFESEFLSKVKSDDELSSKHSLDVATQLSRKSKIYQERGMAVRELRLMLALKGVDKLISTTKKLKQKERECELVQGQMEYFAEKLSRKMEKELLLNQPDDPDVQMMMMPGATRRQRGGEENSEPEVIDLLDEDDD